MLEPTSELSPAEVCWELHVSTQYFQKAIKEPWLHAAIKAFHRSQ